jgi:hypothetical protein
VTAAEQKRKENEKALALKGDNLPPALQSLLEEAKILAYSNLVPLAYAGKPEAVFAVIQYGKELGVGPMVALQNIAFINGRPSMGSELRSAVAHKHPEFAGMKITEATAKKCRVEVYRKFKVTEEIVTFVGEFTIQEAEQAGLYPGKPESAWAKWTRRMLFHRACAFAMQDAFPDVDTGMHTEEEMNPEVFARFQELWVQADNEIIERNMNGGRPMQDGFEAETESQREPVIAPKRGRKPKEESIPKAEKKTPMRNATPRKTGGKK